MRSLANWEDSTRGSAEEGRESASRYKLRHRSDFCPNEPDLEGHQKKDEAHPTVPEYDLHFYILPKVCRLARR